MSIIQLSPIKWQIQNRTHDGHSITIHQNVIKKDQYHLISPCEHGETIRTRLYCSFSTLQIYRNITTLGSMLCIFTDDAVSTGWIMKHLTKIKNLYLRRLQSSVECFLVCHYYASGAIVIWMCPPRGATVVSGLVLSRILKRLYFVLYAVFNNKLK